MKVLIVNHGQVRQWLTMRACMGAMERILRQLAENRALNPLRQVVWLPEKTGLMAMMPACVSDSGVMGVKAISVFPGNSVTEYDSHQGVVMLFDSANGRLLALVDATEVTAVRTAAVSGVATRLLAREDAGDLAILGAGTQACKHLEAMLEARNIRRVRVWNRSPNRAAEFAARESDRRQIAIEAAESAQEAVDGADLVCTTTAATEPVLAGEWVAPGTHVNAVGACIPTARELDSEAVARARLFVDRRESTVNEAGDFIIPKKEGRIDDGHIRGEIGELLLGKVSGRTGADEITLFKSLGLAVEDVAAAHLIYRKALETDAGTWVELNAKRDA